MTEQTPDVRSHIPSSVSAEARAKLEIMRMFLAGMPPPKPPTTVEEFDAAVVRSEAMAEQIVGNAVAALAPTIAKRSLGEIAVLDITPRDYADDGTALIYVHGGGFVMGSAWSARLNAALAASTSGRRVISVDYTLAPRAGWTVILDQVAAVWRALLAEGRVPTSIGMFGDSAGACIATAATLLLRERGDALPAALVLLSPVVDLADKGDTSVTLASVDFFDDAFRDAMRTAYAPGADLRNPLVSPIYGDFASGFPPVLTQVGTRESLLSDAVRLHRALRSAGVASRIEPYEGMPHVFQSFFADTPEGRAAWAEIAAFWSEHLVRPVNAGKTDG